MPKAKRPLFMFCPIELPMYMARYPNISPGAKLCYASLNLTAERVRMMTNENAQLFPLSIEEVAEDNGFAEEEASKYIEELIQDGLVEFNENEDGSMTFGFLPHPVHSGEPIERKQNG